MMTMLELVTGMIATPASPPSAGAAAETISVWDFIVKGGWMMVPIGLCSFVAVTVFVERLVSLRRGRVIPREFEAELQARLAEGPESALAYCRDHPRPIANVCAAGLRRIGASEEVITRHIEDAGRREVLRLRKYLRVLSVIAAVAPLLGLLGTILGMIRAFRTVASSAEALGRTELLAEGIYEAMVTTAAGLVVAIPALIAYHWLSARVQHLVMEIDQTTADVLEAPAPASPSASSPTAVEDDAMDVVDVTLATS